MDLKETIRRFFAGRYGADALNKTLLVVACGLLALDWLWPRMALEAAAWVVTAVVLFRVLSRNIPARYGENQRFLAAVAVPGRLLRKYRYRFGMRQTYRFYTCPNCRKELRVPRNKGKIEIRCPRCGQRFIKKS